MAKSRGTKNGTPKQKRPKQKRLLTYQDAKPRKRQHTSPCSDCPFARTALSGWLGGQTADQWLMMAHGEAKVECHTTIDHQCAGLAIYRANVCKVPASSDIIQLPADRKKCFSTPMEFKEHHTKPMVFDDEP